MTDQRDDTIIDNESGEILPALTAEMSPAISAEINSQVATAKRYPRRRDKEIADEIMGRATVNESIAAECLYSIKRGDKEITGPSIRFAEIARASYGNIRIASRFVRIDADDPMRQAVIVEAVAFDMQTNSSEIIFERRSIMTSSKGGRKSVPYSTDMVAQTAGAARSIARRNAILSVIPKAVWIEGLQRVVRVLQGTVDTLGKRREDVLAAFVRAGAKPEDVFAALDLKSIEDVTVEHMPILIGMLTAIKEGETVASVLGRNQDLPGAGFTPVQHPLRDEPQGGQKDIPQGAASRPTEPPAERGAVQDAPGQPESRASAQPAAAASPAVPLAKPEAREPEPMSNEQYVAASLEFVAGQKSPSAIDDWWRRERKTRTERKLTVEQITALDFAKESRVEELRK